MVVRVALIQVAVTEDEPVAERIARVLEATRTLAEHNDMVILPEMWPIGAFAVELIEAHSQTLDGPLCADLAKIARQTGTWLFSGSIPEYSDQSGVGPAYFNTALAHSPDGDLVGAYRKMHLFGFNGGESAVLSSGDDLVVVDTPLGRTGLATCYDLRFPELFRALMTAGAQAFVVPAGWPERRLPHWLVLARARAIENQAYFLGCNGSGTHGGVPIAGHSVIIDPQGEILAEAGPDEQVLGAELDPTRVAAWRAAFPALDDRRPSS